MTAFDNAIGTLFNDPNLSVTALYKAGGSGAGVNVQVIRVEPSDVVTSIEDLQIVSSTNLFDVRQSDIADPGIGDTLAVPVGGTVYTVQSAPRFDALKKTWRLDCHE